jgi:putative membrane protein
MAQDDGMNLVGQLAALVAGVLHVFFFCLESLWFTRRQAYRRFLVREADAEAVRPWAFNQGFYNLFLALGIFGGVIALHSGQETAGRAVVLFCCAAILGAAVVLIASDRRMARAAALQGLPPLVALAAALL